MPSVSKSLTGSDKVYVGEAKSIYKRLKSHIASPEDKIKKWDRVLVVNDGRAATQSDLNDGVIRKALELYLIKLLQANKYIVVSQGESQTLNATQQRVVEALGQELDFFLLKKNIITKVLEQRGQEEVLGDKLRRLVEGTGRKVEAWGAHEATIDGEKIFIRPGSHKPKGWQITFRGRKAGSFINCLQKGTGYLLISRNDLPLIPLKEVQKVIKDRSAYEQNTIDIWIVFEEEKITLTYKQNSIDIASFRLLKSGA